MITNYCDLRLFLAIKKSALMSGSFYSISDESGAHVSEGFSVNGGARAEAGGAHDEFDLRQWATQFAAERVPDILDKVQRKSMNCHGNKHSWILSLVYLLVAVLLLRYLVRSVRSCLAERRQVIREQTQRKRKKIY